jgi:hypothetical protein
MRREIIREKIQEEIDNDNKFTLDLEILSKKKFMEKYGISSEEYNHLLEAENYKKE